MTAPQGTVRFHHRDRTVTFRVEGRGTMTQSLSLRRHAERLLTEGTDQVRIDLRDCSHMDSTFLGTLLALKKTLDKQSGRLTLVMPSAACSKILYQMGLDNVLDADAADSAPPDAWTELAPSPEDAATFRRTVTQAHEELANLPGPAGEQFKAVVRCLKDAEPPEKPPE